ncbi:hypothetical protein GCM10007383_25690 [Arenibacter certesii]|uniref:Uncharacterized protein n=1 Tax=Arenibacter certesii TaxID=228955 RepID=A0A918IZI9_9FLAO|nr:hypothetical protein GCM10007383_25690 [Arenibacter certesii]
MVNRRWNTFLVPKKMGSFQFKLDPIWADYIYKVDEEYSGSIKRTDFGVGWCNGYYDTAP